MIATLLAVCPRMLAHLPALADLVLCRGHPQRGGHVHRRVGRRQRPGVDRVRRDGGRAVHGRPPGCSQSQEADHACAGTRMTLPTKT